MIVVVGFVWLASCGWLHVFGVVWMAPYGWLRVDGFVWLAQDFATSSDRSTR